MTYRAKGGILFQVVVLLNWLRWAGSGTLTDSDTQQHSTVFIQRIIIF